MAKESKLTSLTRLLWHSACVLSLLFVLGAVGMLYYGGMQDGVSSFQDGRRLVARLDNGHFEGWQAGQPKADDAHDGSEHADSKHADNEKDTDVASEVKLIDAKEDKDVASDHVKKDDASSDEVTEPAISIKESLEKTTEKASDKVVEHEQVHEASKTQEKPVASDHQDEGEKTSESHETKAVANESNAHPAKDEVAVEPEKKDAEKADAEKKNEKSATDTKVETKVEAKNDTGADTASDDTGDVVAKASTAQVEPTHKSKDTSVVKDSDILSLSAVPSVTSVKGINDALTEPSKDGLLPKIGKDGTKPWKYYSKTAEYKGDYPVIAIIVTGLGTSKTATEQALKLPENITLSFSPYAKNVESWATAARATGHEVMLDLPLQPSDYPASDPGPYGLLTDAKGDANDKKLRWLLSRFGAFTGVLTPLNDGFSNDPTAFSALLDSISKRGLILALSRDMVKEETQKIISDNKSPLLVADIILDEDLSEKSIAARLEILKQRAKDKGFAIGIAQGYPISMAKLATLSAMCAKEGFKLMPVSYVAKKRFK